MKEYFGKKIKKLGFGFMRLPGFPGRPSDEIDYELVKEMVDLYMERGFSYFDTAYGYHGGNSEVAIRKAVTERFPRDAFQVTTKMPLWNPLTLDELKGQTNTSLERTGLDYFNLYFMHGIEPSRFEMIEKMNAWDYLRSVKDDGKALNIGFSYHGDADSLNRVLDKHGDYVDIIQLQINYIDWEPRARACYEVAVDHGVGIVVMSPVKGGSLANFTPEVADIYKRANPEASLASWALRFPLNLDGVIVVLSGMSALAQVDDNTTIADTTGPLSDGELKVIADVMGAIDRIPTIPCTQCRYCVDDCPKKINSPGVINLLNEYAKYRNLPGARGMYRITTGGMHGPPAKSSDCIECGECERHCPQGIKVIDAHKEAVKLFE